MRKERRNIKTILKFRIKTSSDVCEIYSPPRIVPEAEKPGLTPGFSLDLTVNRSEGYPFNFSIKRHRDEAVQMVLDYKPYFHIGNPPCTMFRILQNGNRWRHTPEAWTLMIGEAEVHMNLCLQLYEWQRRGGGRYDLHEHPKSASSWALNGKQCFAAYPDTMLVDGNMCQFGMVTTYKGEAGLVEKATMLMTNAPEVAARLNRRCSKQQ